MRDITLCHPRLQLLAAQLVSKCAAQGIIIKIGETLRTAAEQDALYAIGRTQPGSIVTNAPGSSYSSYHQWGTAFDIYLAMDVDGDGKTSDDSYNNTTKLFDRIGAIGVSIGLEWGGNWKSIVDNPHFQLPDWGSSTSGIKKLYANPAAFMKTWQPTYTIGWNQGADGWKFYLSDAGTCVRNDWHQEPNGNWYWFDGAGHMVTSTWYQYKGDWYYLGADGAMVTGQQTVDGKWYVMDKDGRMVTEPVTLTPDKDGALRYPRIV